MPVGHTAMYRSAAKRLLPALCRQRKIPDNHIRSVSILHNLPRFSTSTTSESIPNQNPSSHFDSASSSSSSTSTNAFSEEEKERGHDHDGRSTRTARPGGAQFKDEQARVFRASLHHVIRFGWTEAAMIAGAREAGVSPSIVGSFPRKEAALVEVEGC